MTSLPELSKRPKWVYGGTMFTQTCITQNLPVTQTKFVFPSPHHFSYLLSAKLNLVSLKAFLISFGSLSQWGSGVLPF